MRCVALKSPLLPGSAQPGRVSGVGACLKLVKGCNCLLISGTVELLEWRVWNKSADVCTAEGPDHSTPQSFLHLLAHASDVTFKA